MHDKLIDLMGRLNFRVSYSQNVLRHSIEVAYLTGLLAEQLGLDGALADAQVQSQFTVTPIFGVFEQQDFGIAAGEPLERPLHEPPAFLGKEPGERIGGRAARPSRDFPCVFVRKPSFPSRLEDRRG